MNSEFSDIIDLILPGKKDPEKLQRLLGVLEENSLLRERVAVIEVEKRNLESGIRDMFSSESCPKHQDDIRAMSFQDFLNKNKEIGCKYCLSEKTDRKK